MYWIVFNGALPVPSCTSGENAYVYSLSGGLVTYVTRFAPTASPSFGRLFGNSVSVNNFNLIMVGAPLAGSQIPLLCFKMSS